MLRNDSISTQKAGATVSGRPGSNRGPIQHNDACLTHPYRSDTRLTRPYTSGSPIV